MKSICFFCTYFNGHDIPYYVRVYLEELSRHFTTIHVLTNKKDLHDEALEFLEKKGLQIHYYPNEGYDFGMWSKALKEINTDGFERIGLINDSTILFRDLNVVFNVMDEKQWDFAGLIASSNINWHIQSWFLVINKNAIGHLKNYFLTHAAQSDIKDVIVKFEVGLSQYLLKQGLQAGTVFQSPLTDGRSNPSYLDITRLIKAGFPVIKKKLIFGNYRSEEIPGLLIRNFNFNSEYYIRLIESTVPETLIDFNHLKMDYYTAFHVIRESSLQFVSKVLLFPLKLMPGRRV